MNRPEDDLAVWFADLGDSPAVATPLPVDLPLPGSAEILAAIDCGLLAWPYLQVLTPEGPVPHDTVFTTRTVQNHAVPGFVHRSHVLDLFGSGATLRFPSVDDWQAQVRPVVRAARRSLESGIEATAYLTIGGVEPILPQDRGETIVLVCSGTLRWTIHPVGDGNSGERVVELGPGQALNLPAGARAHAVAGPDDCLLLTLARRVPTPRELINAVQEAALAQLAGQPQTELHHLMPIEAKADWVRDELNRFYAGLDPAELLQSLADVS